MRTKRIHVVPVKGDKPVLLHEQEAKASYETEWPNDPLVQIFCEDTRRHDGCGRYIGTKAPDAIVTGDSTFRKSILFCCTCGNKQPIDIHK